MVPCQLEDDGMLFTSSNPKVNSLPLPANNRDFSLWLQLLEWLQHLEMNITSSSSKYHVYIKRCENVEVNLEGKT
jgi:hypothetical protein